jgi:hypothetical protein
MEKRGGCFQGLAGGGWAKKEGQDGLTLVLS